MTPNPNQLRRDVLLAAMAAKGGTWTTARAEQVFADAGLIIDRNSVWGLLRELTLGTAQDNPTKRRPVPPPGTAQLDLFGGTA